MKDKKTSQLTAENFKKQLPMIVVGLVVMISLWLIAFFMLRDIWAKLEAPGWLQ